MSERHVEYGETTRLTSGTSAAAISNGKGNNYDTLPEADAAIKFPEERVIGQVLTAVEARRSSEKKVLLGALLFCFTFMVVEFASGVIAHSLALLTDAIHLLTDVGSYALSIGALMTAGRAACGRFNYGWHRAEVIGTLISVFSIWALVAWIVMEAGYRTYDMYRCSRVPAHVAAGAKAVRECQAVDSRLMIIVGVLGMVVNMVCASILYFGGSHGHSHFGSSSHGHSHGGEDAHEAEHDQDQEIGDEHDHSHGHDHDHEHGHEHEHGHGHGHGLNTRGGGGLGSIGSHKGFAVHAAILHAMGDCVQSVGVILAGVFIYISNQYVYGTHSYEHSLFNLADPFCSLLFAVVTLNMTRALLMDLFGILMESTPASIDYGALELALQQIEGVESVHDLHVWSLSSEYVSLSVHLVADDSAAVLLKAQHICKHHFGIGHTTIQVDSILMGTTQCADACAPPNIGSDGSPLPPRPLRPVTPPPQI